MTSLALQLGHGPEAVELAAKDLPWIHELRVPKGLEHAGEWVHAPSAVPGKGLDRYVVPDPERLFATRGYKNPSDHPFWKAHPVSPENIVAAYDAADEGTRAQGMNWYEDIHHLAGLIGQGDAGKGAILLSAYSPQKVWPVNMFQAMRSARRGKALGPGEGMAITGNDQRRAQAAIDGADIEEVMNSAKTHSFGVLLQQGDDSPDDPYGHVVIDTHAVNVAAGGTIRGKKNATAPIGDARQHEYVADQYRKAAKMISERDGKLVKPHQLQAVTWLVQKQANDAEEAYLLEHPDKADPQALRLIKGRVTMTKNAWRKWLAYAKKHNIPLQAGISAPAEGYALAAQLLAIELGSLAVQLGFDPDEPRGKGGKWISRGMPWDRGEGTTVRYHGSLGISRADMPQLSGTVRGEYQPSSVMQPKFIAHLRDRGISVTRERVPASELRPTQADGDLRPIQGIAGRLQDGGSAKPIFVSSDNRVLDGHHTWAARQLAGAQSGNPEMARMDIIRAGVPIGELLRQAEDFGAAQGIAKRASGVVANPKYQHDVASDEIASPPRLNLGGITRPGSVRAQAVAARPAVEKILGGKSAWTGNLGTWDDSDLARRRTAGQMYWNGDMGLHGRVAYDIQQAGADPQSKINPEAYNVLLHEMIHSVIPEGQGYADHEDAYQQPVPAAIEEGFTELGTQHHAAEFYRAMGIAGRDSNRVRDEPGSRDKPYRTYRMGELAEARNDPALIADGGSGGTYIKQVAAAQKWVQGVAEAEGYGDQRKGTPGWRRTIELTDEVNRQGTRDKPWVLADQVLRSQGVHTVGGARGMEVQTALRRWITERWVSDDWGDTTVYQGAVRMLQTMQHDRPELFEKAAA